MMAARLTAASRVETLRAMLGSPDGRNALAEDFQSALFRHALDAQWPATRDAECGGFLTDLDHRWRPNGEQTKSLEFIARHTRAYARAALAFPGRGYDEAARQGFTFLTERMWDAEHGGFFTLLDRRGKPMHDGRKHPHGHFYVVDACVEIAPLIGESVARVWGLRAFDWLETVAWDAQHGGYWGYYERDNRPILPDGRPSYQRYDWIGTPLGSKDFNVTDDALATLTALMGTGWDQRAASRLQWHAELFLDQLVPRSEVVPYLFQRDWTTAPDIPRSGQCFQLITALLHAGAAVGRFDDALAACKRLAGNSAEFFAHPDGGYGFARSVYAWPLRGVDLTVSERSWWVQNEAARGFLLLALLNPDDANRQAAFARQWMFIETHMIDHRFHGFYESAEQGRSVRHWRVRSGQSRNKLNIWKDVSHETHLLMDAVEWLRHGPGLTEQKKGT